MLERAPSLPARAGAASAASGAMLCPGLELRDAGADLRALGLASAALWPAFRDELEAASGSSIGYRACGALYVADPPPRGPGLDGLSGDAARRLEPALTENVPAAAFEAGAALVDPIATLAALERAARAEGVAIRTDARVARGPDGVLRVGADEVCAERIVVAAGAWTSDVLGVPLTRPVKGQMLSLRARGRAPSRLIWGEGIYVIPEADGRIIVGATQEDMGFDERVSAEAIDELRARAEELCPGLADADEIERWAGFRPATRDGRPAIGDVAGMTVATGQHRNGYLFAPLIAEWAAHHALTGELPDDARPFDVARLSR